MKIETFMWYKGGVSRDARVVLLMLYLGNFDLDLVNNFVTDQNLWYGGGGSRGARVALLIFILVSKSL